MFGARSDGRTRSGTPADWLVVGLGNPGAEYEGTRHNLGEAVIALLAQRHGAKLRLGKERALSAEIRLPGPAPTNAAAPGARPPEVLVAIAYPQTYMNLSGESVRPLALRHGITDPARIVVVHDELDLPSGIVRCKLGGGTAGNNGLKSIQAHLGTNAFARVRIGIGKPPGQQTGADFVLKRPGKAERELLAVATEEAADAVEQICAVGFERTQNDVNARSRA